MNSDNEIIYFGEMVFYVKEELIVCGKGNNYSYPYSNINSTECTKNTKDSLHRMGLNGTSYIRRKDELKLYYNAVINLYNLTFNFEQILKDTDLKNYPFFDYDAPIGTGSVDDTTNFLYFDLDSDENQISLILSMINYAKQCNQDVTLHLRYWAKKKNLKFGDGKNDIKNPQFLHDISNRFPHKLLYVTEYKFYTHNHS